MDELDQNNLNNNLDSDHNSVNIGSNINSLETGKLPDTPVHVIEEYMNTLKSNQKRWAQEISLEQKISMLEEVCNNVDNVFDDWVRLDKEARHIPADYEVESFFSVASAATAKKIIQLKLETLYKLKEHGGTKPFSEARQDGERVIVKSFPLSKEHESETPGVRGEVWLEKGTKVDELASYQASRFKDKSYEGSVTLVLAAGNVSTLVITDFLNELFVHNNVIVIKNNPVLEYMGGILEKILEPFINEGFVKVVVGGAKEGRILADHPLVDNIHLTGSDKTFEAIVYGPGEQGRKNKALDHRINKKNMTAELGNVSPLIVVPGDWSEEDFDTQAGNIVEAVMAFSGYTCLALRVLVLPKNWDGSKKLLDKVTALMRDSYKGINYYPGTNTTLKEAMSCYPNADVFGDHTKDKQPIVLVKGLEFNEEGRDEVAFHREFWATFTAQAYLDEDDKHKYLEKAVEYVNKNLWGTLSAGIVVDPESEKELESKGTLKKAIADLRYGTVAINKATAYSYLLGMNTWGAYPGSTYDDIQSGNVFQHNMFLLDRIEKSVFYHDFRDKK